MTRAGDERTRDHERQTAARIASLVDTADVEVDSIAAELTELYRESIPVYDLVARDEIERNTRAVLDSLSGKCVATHPPSTPPN